ncbi:Hypothetical predicted protein [Cloeon dipterum]|uniref:Uncharacterized protein n=1 Tax=Cloeon dipterum TaxID=197152 RepID=A0A8S1BWY0_9INSE|nr:Hypothetical predicted protein [Cloeon dipterum]
MKVMVRARTGSNNAARGTIGLTTSAFPFSVNVGNLNIQKLTGGTCCLRVVKQLTEEVENRRETEFGRPFHKR